jgi:ATP-dependent Lon protease
MLGPMGSIVMGVFRVLTPSSIEQMVSATSLRDRDAPVLGIDTVEIELDQPKAKILPFTKKEKQEEESQSEDQAEHHQWHSVQRVANGDQVEANSIASSQTRRSVKEIEDQKQRKEQEVKNQTSSEFILSQRESIRSTNKKVVEQSGKCAYQNSSTKSSAVQDQGILVDKKHF